MMKGTVGMISALLLLYFAAPSSRAFIDDFDDGNLDGWKVQSGNWKVKDGELQYKGGNWDLRRVFVLRRWRRMDGLRI